MSEADPRETAAPDRQRWGELELEVFVDPARTLGPLREAVTAELLELCDRIATFDASHLVMEEIRRATWLMVARKNGAVVGFSMATLLCVNRRWVLYLNFMMFAPQARGQGLLTGQIEYLIRQAARRLKGGELYLVSLSGNPQIVGAVHHYPWSFPRAGKRTPERLQQVALDFARHLYPSLHCDREPPVLRKISPQDPSRGGLPRHRDPRVNAFCEQHLDFFEGDEFILVGRLGPLQRRLIYLACWMARARAWSRRKRKRSEAAAGTLQAQRK